MKTLFTALAILSPAAALAHDAGAPHAHPHPDVGLSVAVLAIVAAVLLALYLARRS